MAREAYGSLLKVAIISSKKEALIAN